MRTVIETREGPDGVFRPKEDGIGGALDELEEFVEQTNGIADLVDAGAERLNAIMERRKFLRGNRRARIVRAEKVTE